MFSGQKTFFFIHQNMPAQFVHLVRYLAGKGHNVYYITASHKAEMPGVVRVAYKAPEPAGDTVTGPLRPMVDSFAYGLKAVRALEALRDRDIRPDIIIGHTGWGEMLFVREVFPDVPVVGYFEFFFRVSGTDVGFDPEYPPGPHIGFTLTMRNMVLHSGIELCDAGVTPTRWQWSTFPQSIRSRLTVLHEGVDTEAVRRLEGAAFELPDGRVLTQADKVVTYVARKLEPYRGFPSFMRAIPEILERNPEAHVVLVGGESVSYGKSLPDGETYRQRMEKEVAIDPARVHFVGQLPYKRYLQLLHVSSAHVYLTYPFVLSWSLVESMAAECLIIGSRTAPVEEVITDGQNGLLVDFFSPADIAEKVTRAVQRPRDFLGLRAAARRFAVEHFDLKTVTLPAHLALIRDVMG